jgi:hypothetical protein
MSKTLKILEESEEFWHGNPKAGLKSIKPPPGGKVWVTTHPMIAAGYGPNVYKVKVNRANLKSDNTEIPDHPYGPFVHQGPVETDGEYHLDRNSIPVKHRDQVMANPELAKQYMRKKNA